MHADWLGGDGCPIFIASDVETGLHNAVHNADVAGCLTLRWCLGKHDNPRGMLNDFTDASVDSRGFSPERLAICEAVGHQTVIEADIDAIGFVE